MKTGILWICTAAVLLSLSFCKKKTQNVTNYTPNCSGTKSFQNDVRPIFVSSCNTSGCHSNYSTYAQISANASSIRSMVANGSMPKNGSLSDAQKDNILCWIDAGSPNN